MQWNKHKVIYTKYYEHWLNSKYSDSYTFVFVLHMKIWKTRIVKIAKLQKFSVLACRPNLPKTVKLQDSFEILIVLGIYNFGSTSCMKEYRGNQNSTPLRAAVLSRFFSVFCYAPHAPLLKLNPAQLSKCWSTSINAPFAAYLLIYCKAVELHISLLKGQLISEANYKVFIWTKNWTKIFLYFCPCSLKWVKSKKQMQIIILDDVNNH